MVIKTKNKAKLTPINLLLACLVLGCPVFIYSPASAVEWNPVKLQTAFQWQAEQERAALAGDAYAARTLCSDRMSGPRRIEWCKLASEHRDADAPYILAGEYAFGWHVPANAAEAVRWYRVAAERGSGVARSVLVWSYLYGIGVEKDETQAAYWAKRAARADQVSSYFWMGWLAEHGLGGIEQDYAAALRWYLKKVGAEPYADADFRLGMLYARGLGVTADQEKAQHYFAISEELVRVESRFVGNRFSASMGQWRAGEARPFFADEPDLVKRARERASTPQGDPESEFYLGGLYASGLGVDKDERESFKWYLRAAEHGHIGAMFNVAVSKSYWVGLGTERNDAEAIKWFKRASDAGDIRATYALGMLRLFPDEPGSNKQKDPATLDKEAGLRLVQEAADKGLSEAQKMIAHFYARGLYLPQDLKLAEEWWMRSARREAEMRAKSISEWELQIPPLPKDRGLAK